MHTRPRIIYISYDGVEEPLGQSQVLPYLVRLAQEFDITLISFEKTSQPRAESRQQLMARNIRWEPRRYHRRPPVISTALDVFAGSLGLIRAAREAAPTIVHVRSYVPALIAVVASRITGGKLLFDIRGFWADERVDGGLWRRGSLIYRVAKRCERAFFARADAIVTLTNASVPQIRAWSGDKAVSVDVIPTCVELGNYQNRPQRPGGPHVVWLGSVGTWYRFDLVARVASATSLPLTVLTRETQLAGEILNGYPASVRAVASGEVPQELFAGDIGLCLILSSFSKTASAPTRFGEYLAAGMPVIVTPGVGDLESIVEEHGVGVVLRGEDEHSIAAAAARVRALAADGSVQDRCRAVARRLFDVEMGSARYADIYRRLATDPLR